MKTVYIIGGGLLGVFAITQLLQLLGLIGVGFSLVGIGVTILAAVGSYVCFQRAMSPHEDSPVDK